MAVSTALTARKNRYGVFHEVYEKLKTNYEGLATEIFCEVCSDKKNHAYGDSFKKLIQGVQVNLSTDRVKEIRDIGDLLEVAGEGAFQGKVRYIPSVPGLFGMKILDEHPMLGKEVEIEISEGNKKLAIVEEISVAAYNFTGEEGYSQQVYFSFIGMGTSGFKGSYRHIDNI